MTAMGAAPGPPPRPSGRGSTPAALAAAAAVVLLSGCAGSPPPGDATAEAAPDTVRGTVRQVGSTPFVRTVVEGTDTVTVTGDLEPEVARLAGARVRVFGALATGDFPGPALEAVGYDVLSVDGRRPEVGVLRADRDGLYLERPGGEPLRLRGVTSSLDRSVGAKIWVVTGEDGSVLRYGILRPPEQ